MSAILEALFSSTARVEVLRLFLLHPERPFYQREIERETGQPIRAIQREVERLEEIGLLLRTPEGNRIFYRLNSQFPGLAELQGLFRKASGDEAPASGDEAPAPAGVDKPALPAEPASIRQPFAWMETLAIPPLPASLRRRQVEGEWDRGY